MPSDRLSDTECQIVRCQGEYPDVYDAHYDAIEQLKAVNMIRARARDTPGAKFRPRRAKRTPLPKVFVYSRALKS